MIKFSDGIDINTDGELRILKLSDGYYVVGQGFLIPCLDREEAERIIKEEREKK